jgi:hypothetical protein
MKIIKININNEMTEIDINKTNNILEELNKIDSDEIEEVCYWNQSDIIIKCYGCYSSDNILCNNHDLPPGEISITNLDISEINIINNIYLVMFRNNILQNYTISQYGELVYMMNEQYEFDSDFNISNIDEDIEEKLIDKISEVTNNNFKDNIIDVLDYDNNIY